MMEADQGYKVSLKDMSIRDVLRWRVKKILIEFTSVKFWGAIFLGILNAHIVFKDSKFDLFGMGAFLGLMGIRSASKLIEKKQNGEGGDPK